MQAILGVPTLLRQQGFSTAETSERKWPIGGWAEDATDRKLGEMMQADLILALEGTRLRLFTKVLGWEESAVRKHIKDVEADMRAGQMRAYIPITIVWAQKPHVAAQGADRQ